MSMTWAPRVAMTDREMNAFLNEKNVARMATIRPDGYPHVTPLWYAWDGRYLWFILGHGERPRQHIRNLRYNPRVAVIIDRDERPRAGDLTPGAQGVLIRGRAELMTDDQTQREVSFKVLSRYGTKFGAALEAVLQDGKPGMNRVIARIKPDKIYAWDFLKLESGYKEG